MLESGEITADNRKDEIYFSSAILADEEIEPMSMGEKETYMSLTRTKAAPKIPEVITSPISKGRRTSS